MILLSEQNYPIESDPTFDIHDSSKSSTFMDCPRRYFYEYVLGWRPAVPSNHLVFGQALHAALEIIHESDFGRKTDEEEKQLVARAYTEFIKIYRETFSDATDGVFFPKNPKSALTSLLYYVQKYSEHDKQYEVLHTEVAGRVPISDEDFLSLRIDVILRDRSDGKKFIMDHKTSSSLDGFFRNQWRSQWALSFQMGTYVHALYCAYEPNEIFGARINGLFFAKPRKVADKNAGNATLDYERVPIYKPYEHLNNWLFQAKHLLSMVKQEFDRLSQCKKSDPILFAFPMNTNSCQKFGGCPYFDFCTGCANPLALPGVPGGFEVRRWNPEKENSESAKANIVGNKITPITVLQNETKEGEDNV